MSPERGSQVQSRRGIAISSVDDIPVPKRPSTPGKHITLNKLTKYAGLGTTTHSSTARSTKQSSRKAPHRVLYTFSAAGPPVDLQGPRVSWPLERNHGVRHHVRQEFRRGVHWEHYHREKRRLRFRGRGAALSLRTLRASNCFPSTSQP